MSNHFRADFLTQTPDLQDSEVPPVSQVKTGLHGAGLPAVLKDQTGRSVLVPVATAQRGRSPKQTHLVPDGSKALIQPPHGGSSDP